MDIGVTCQQGLSEPWVSRGRVQDRSPTDQVVPDLGSSLTLGEARLWSRTRWKSINYKAATLRCKYKSDVNFFFYEIQISRVAQKISNLELRLPSGSAVKNPPAMQGLQESRLQSLGQEDPLEKDMANHSSILA